MKRILIVAVLLLILVLTNVTQLSFAARERDIPIIYGVDSVPISDDTTEDVTWLNPILPN